MKKWLLVLATAVGASIVKKNLDKSQADKDLWAEATGKPEPTTGPAADPIATPVNNPS